MSAGSLPLADRGPSEVAITLRIRAPITIAGRAGAGRCLSGSSQRGQTLVEFVIVVPVFLAMITAIVEFAFVFNALLATNLASRDAALLAAEAGTDVSADCVVLQAVEAGLDAPASRAQIQRVEIFRADSAGAPIGAATIYLRTGSVGCPKADGTTVALPYTRTRDGYPISSRCNILAGCGGSQSTVDLVGVRVTYRHTWRTPIGSTFGPYLDVVRSNSMRMEPVL